MKELADYCAEAVTGPEVLTGSTRLKAGTAEKMILNMLSTAAMVRLGKVYSNYMVDVKPMNEKLVRRARNIVMEVTGCDEARAAEAMEASGNHCMSAIRLIQGKTEQ
jgi:N-acetylmuramic acid 6-phosphate etherase